MPITKKQRKSSRVVNAFRNQNKRQFNLTQSNQALKSLKDMVAGRYVAPKASNKQSNYRPNSK